MRRTGAAGGYEGEQLPPQVDVKAMEKYYIHGYTYIIGYITSST
jgi:hypothetical protein